MFSKNAQRVSNIILRRHTDDVVAIDFTEFVWYTSLTANDQVLYNQFSGSTTNCHECAGENSHQGDSPVKTNTYQVCGNTGHYDEYCKQALIRDAKTNEN